jgi:type II secretion system (T2SS) protein E
VNPTLQPAPADDAAQEDPAMPEGRPSPERKPLGTLLVEAGLIDEDQLELALREGSRTGERVGEVVARHRWATEDEVARVLAEQWGLSYVDRASIWFDASALARLSREDAQHLEALPIRVEGDRVMVAVAEPTDQRLAELRRVIGEDTVVVVVPKTALDAGIRSELLTSRGPSTGEPKAEDPSAEEQPAEEPRAEPVAEERSAEQPAAEARPVAATPVASAPVQLVSAPVQPDRTDDVAGLAAQARNIADFVAGQVATIREYELHIDQLESQLAESRAATQETKTQLAAVLQLVDILKPSV